MSKTLALIAECTCETVFSSSKFHFQGYLDGQKIKKILVVGGKFQENKFYLVHVKDCKIIDCILYGQHVKSKELEK